MAVDKSDESRIKNIEQELQKLDDEEVLKILLHTIRDPVRTKEVKSMGIIQEIIRELSGAGI